MNALERWLKTPDGGFMILAAVRYAMGRMSYAPGLVADGVRCIWSKLDENTQKCIRRDIDEELERYARMGTTMGMECDHQTWTDLFAWIKEHQ